MFKLFIKSIRRASFSRFLYIWLALFLSLTWFIFVDSLVNSAKSIIFSDVKSILGADIVMESSSRLTWEQLSFLHSELAKYNGKVGESIEFSTTAIGPDEQVSLANVTILDPWLPYYGEVEAIKVANSSWIYVDQNTYQQLNPKVLNVFGTSHTLEWYIGKFPGDNLASFAQSMQIYLFSGQSSELLNWELSSLIGFGSRVSYNYMMKVDEQYFDEIVKSLREHFPWAEIEDYKRGVWQAQELLTELDRYIKTVLLLGFLIAVSTMFLAIESFFLQHRQTLGVLRILWATLKQIVSYIILFFLLLFLVVFGLSSWIAYFAMEYINNFPMAASFGIYGISVFKWFILWGIIMLFSLAYPLSRFFRSQALDWLKENFFQTYSSKELATILFLFFVWICIITITALGDILRWSLISVALFAIMAVIIYVGYGLLRFISSMLQKSNLPFVIKDSFRASIKPWNVSSLILSSFFVWLSATLIISVLSSTFLSYLYKNLSSWVNIFVINILQEDVEDGKIPFEEKNLYSIILWRIVQVNWKTLQEHLWQDRIPQRYTREFNITTHSLANDPIIRWDALTNWWVSVDQNFAKNLELNLGDSIEFSIAWIQRTFVVQNIRQSIRWWFTPFFYFQLPEDDMKNFPKTYFYVDNVDPQASNAYKLNILNSVGSHVSFVDIWQIVDSLKEISEKILYLIYWLLWYILLFAFLCLQVCILFLRWYRQYRNKLLNYIGADSKFLWQSFFIEYGWLVFLSGFFALVTGLIVSSFIISGSEFLAIDIESYFVWIWLLTWILIILLLTIYSQRKS